MVANDAASQAQEQKASSPRQHFRMVIDGSFDDWNSISPAIVDPSDAPEAFVDFGEIRLAHDDWFVHLLIDLGKTVNAQGLDGTAMILLDADGNPSTGRTEFGLDGVDLVIDLTPPNERRPERPSKGMGIRSTTYSPDPNDAKAKALTVYDINLAFAPTYAGRRMEFRIDRGAKLPNTPPLFEGQQFSVKLVFVDLSGALQDETEAVTATLSRRVDARQAQADDPEPLARAQRTDLRILSWNVQRSAFLSSPRPFIRSLAAIKPDVLLLQELTDRNTAEEVVSFLNRALPLGEAQSWQVVFGKGGDDLRCAIASRFPLQSVEQLDGIPSERKPGETVRAVGAMIQRGNKRLLAVSAHLKCCGRAGGSEDEERIVDVQTIKAAIMKAANSTPIDGLVIAGDFNLVGARDPLEVFASSLDRDHTELMIVDAYQLDRLSNSTWSDPKQPFAPGRLDFMLYSDSSLRALNCFVYDSRDLSARSASLYAVEPDDSIAASDHFPVVADFSWTAR